MQNFVNAQAIGQTLAAGQPVAVTKALSVSPTEAALFFFLRLDLLLLLHRGGSAREICSTFQVVGSQRQEGFRH